MFKKLVFAVTLLAAVPVAVHAQSTGEDVASINHLLHGMFDKPDEKLSVEPVTVSGDHAVADWAQGQMGGRALLRRQHQGWTIILCAGDAIKSAEALTKAGVPAADASKLEAEVAAAEAKLAPEKVAMFSRFEGLVMMEGKDGSSHPPALTANAGAATTNWLNAAGLSRSC